jgi:mRNA interferase HigB
LREFAVRYPDAQGPLQDFRRLIERGEYRSFAALRATFASADKMGNRYVFNIGGNKYRLVAAIAYSVQVLWVKAVLTHAEYDKEEWE